MTRAESDVAVVIVAAGSGTRLGADLPKAFVRVGGQSLLTRAVASAGGSPLVGLVVVVAPASHLDEAAAAATEAGAVVEVTVVAGGADRCASVSAGLAAVPPSTSVVLVHDAARALTPTSLFTAVIEAVRSGHTAVVPGLAVVDTIKQVDESGRVVATPDRSALRAVQTPQGFERAVLDRAHAAALATGAGRAVSDDASLVELLGVSVHVIPGDVHAHKITTPEDLVLADTLLGEPR